MLRNLNSVKFSNILLQHDFPPINCVFLKVASLKTIFRHENLFLFTHPSARAGYDTRSIFKRSLTGLNSEFSFS